jgi:hypothetical protein
MFKNLSSILIVLFLVAGCATTPTIPAGCGKSVIYKSVPNADLIGTLGVVAIAEGMAVKPEAKVFICGMSTSMMTALTDEKLTYLDFATILTDNVKWLNTYFGQRILIYKALFIEFDKPIAISPCDHDYLMRNLNLLRTGC